MAAYHRLNAETKKKVIETFLQGESTLLEIANMHGMSESEVSYLVTNYFKSKKKKKMIEQFFANAPKRFLTYAIGLTKDIDDAHDIIQEAIISIWRSRENTTDLNDGYFRFVIKQKFIDLTRRRVKNMKLLLDAEPISHNDALSRLYLEELNKVIDSANPLHKEVFSMNMAGYKFREIAEILSIPEGTALGAMRYIRTHIKNKLLHHGKNILDSQNL